MILVKSEIFGFRIILLFFQSDMKLEACLVSPQDHLPIQSVKTILYSTASALILIILFIARGMNQLFS